MGGGLDGDVVVANADEPAARLKDGGLRDDAVAVWGAGGLELIESGKIVVSC
jgi:hypothetical protein